MSLDQPDKNKMMTAPPAKKEFHFAGTLEHFAEVVYAATIEEAEAIYHRIKRPTGTIIGTAPRSEQSTAAVDEEIKQ
jgi:hypothetical protein